MNKTELFLSEIKKVEEREVPVHVTKRAKLALLDYIGVTYAGFKEQRDKVRLLTESFAESGGEIYPVGMNVPMSMNNAAFLNGLNGHALDFDDGTNAGIIHLGSPLFSVLLALAQKYGFDGERLLKAAILGYEASFTMAMTIQPVHKARGYHATGTCGVLGIAVAASYVLGFDKDKAGKAFGTAAVSATGTLKVLEDGSELKPYNVAKAALLGITAVQMAMAGFKTADDCLSGNAGFLSQMHGNGDAELKKPLLGGTYAIEKAYIKPYAACRYTHPSIDIALELRKDAKLSASEIDRIEIKTYSLAVKKHDHTDIKGAASAKMSIPYNFAVTYVTGKTGMDAFSPDCLNDEEVKNITAEIKVFEDDEMSAAFPQKTIAAVEIFAKDGRRFSGRSELPKGEPENPLSDEEAKEKFLGLMNYAGKSAGESEQIFEAVMNVETALSRLLTMLKN